VISHLFTKKYVCANHLKQISLPLFLVVSFFWIFCSTSQGIDDKDAEYLVLFRGSHFCTNMEAQTKESVSYDSQQEFCSRFVSFHEGLAGNECLKEQLKKALKKLREGGPFKPQQSSSQTYPSAYHWVQGFRQVVWNISLREPFSLFLGIVLARRNNVIEYFKC
jgi:hypothetical protein